MIDVVAAVLLLGGALLGLIAALGLQQFPDVFARMHSATKAATLGLVLILSGTALRMEGADEITKLGLIVILQLITAPIAAHMVGRSAYRAGTELAPGTAVDELADAPDREDREEERPAARERLGATWTRRLLPGVWLVVVWVALWRDLTAANVVGGLLAATVVMAGFPSLRAQPVSGRLHPLWALRFTAFFAWKLVEASVVVAWEVITPNNEAINEGIVAVPMAGTSDALVTLVANAVSLTPGTLTVEVAPDGDVIYVHVLHLRSMDEVRSEVTRLERYAVEAFGSPTDVALVRARARRLKR